MMLAIIDRIEQLCAMGEAGRQTALNEPITFRPSLEELWYNRWKKHVHSDVFKPTFTNPNIHLQYEPFYTLAPKLNAKYTGGYSINTIEKAFRGIVLDQPLRHLLVENPEEREELKQILIGQI